MSDNPSKRGRQDRRTVSRQPNEVGHVILQLTQRHIDVFRDQVVKSIFAARDAIVPTEGESVLMADASAGSIDSSDSAMPIYIPGTVLARPKGAFTHWGVVTERGTVFHNTPEWGEHESSFLDFAARNPVSVQYRITNLRGFFTRLHERRTNPRAYDAASWNCEDTVAYLAGSWPRLTQVFVVALAVAAVALLVVNLRKQ